MAAIDETEVIQTDSTVFLTADDLQGITGQLDQLLTGQTSLESKFDLYTSDALDRLTNLDNNIKEIRDYLLETEQQIIQQLLIRLIIIFCKSMKI